MKEGTPQDQDDTEKQWTASEGKHDKGSRSSAKKETCTETALDDKRNIRKDGKGEDSTRSSKMQPSEERSREKMYKRQRQMVEKNVQKCKN